MIELDGSMGEGGGQIIRTALSLSAITGKAFKIQNIRANRTPPGLKPQHLTAVNAMEEICGAHVTGAELGSTSLEFTPGKMIPGEYKFDIGTAGSVTLLLQTILPAALSAEGNIEIEAKGGTNVPHAPPIDHFIHVFLQTLKAHGARIEADLVRRGYYPKGGGTVMIEIWPGHVKPIELTEFTLGNVHCISFASGRHESAARRQENYAKLELLKQKIIPTTIIEDSKADCPGGGVQFIASSKTSKALLGADALWDETKPDDKVGTEAAQALLLELSKNPAVDRHMADQLLIYLALSGGRIRTSEITQHTTTNIQVIEKFLPARFEIKETTIEAKPA